MKLRTIIYICLATLISAGCMKEDAEMDEKSRSSIIAGHITDINGNPLEHIKVALEISGSNSDAVYSSSEGTYKAFFKPEWDKNGKCEVKICIEDIDGKDNGGEFTKTSDTIMLLRDNLTEERIRIEKDYCLQYATD